MAALYGRAKLIAVGLSLLAAALTPLVAGPAGRELQKLDQAASGAASADDAACDTACLALRLPNLPGAADLGGLVSGAFDIFSTGAAGAEPTIGVTGAGSTIFIQNALSTMRSSDSGVTWTEIGPLHMNSILSFDPMMYYDPVVDRIYVDQLTVECTVMAWADSASTVGPGLTSWKTNPHACFLPGLDHPKLEAGPSPTFGVANQGRVLYLAASQAGGGIVVARSADGGFTWTGYTAIDSIARGTFLWPGSPVVADPAGDYVYVLAHSPSKGLQYGVSASEGLLWQAGTVTTGYGSSGHAVDPDVAIDSSGTVYAVWYSILNHQIYYSYSNNHGTTWSTPVQVSVASSTGSTVFPSAVSLSDGKLDIAYLGTPNSTAGPNACAATGSSRCVWYVYMAQITSADSASPSTTITQVTPASDPIQVGRICIDGADCTGTPNGRNLLDFIDIEVDDSGYAHIAYTDGCIGGCGVTTTGQTTGEAGRYARQTSGSTI